MSEELLAKLRARQASPAQPPGELGSLPRCESAALFWSQRAASELAAVPAFSQTALALVRESLELDAVAAVAGIVADEVRHTELARALAEQFGGIEVREGEGWSDAQLLARPRGEDLSYWLVTNGCVNETLSLALLQARARKTQHPAVLEVLRTTARDEAVHARFCWYLAARLLPRQTQAARDMLGIQVESLLGLLRRSVGTRGMSAVERAQARRVRSETAGLGLGALPPDEADALVEATITDSILPRLEKLGVTPC